MNSTVTFARYAAAAPLAAAELLRQGVPLGGRGMQVEGFRTAVRHVGLDAHRLLVALLFHGGALDERQLAFEARAATSEQVAAAVERLEAIGVVDRVGAGLRATDLTRGSLTVGAVSMHDQQAATTEEVAAICRTLGISPVPSRKADRIELIATLLFDPRRSAVVMDGLPVDARALLDEIADEGGIRPLPVGRLGISRHDVDRAAFGRYGGVHASPKVLALRELTTRGLVGTSPWEGLVWIWREAWPALRRPLEDDWSTPPAPTRAPVAPGAAALPEVLDVLDRALEHWAGTPPPVLKSGALRIGKPAVRSTAKALGVPEAVVEIVAELVVALEVVLPNVVSASGRGRNRKVDEAFLADPRSLDVLRQLPPATRLQALVRTWLDDGDARPLVVWELAGLPDGHGIADVEAFVNWMEARYLPSASADAIVDAVVALRALGLATPVGEPLALTAVGRLVVDDPEGLAELSIAPATKVTVQADQTIVCPPDLDTDVRRRLTDLAVEESRGGAVVLRLDPRRVILAIQRGATADELLAFLDEVSATKVPPTVRHLVLDAARDADRVQIVVGATVVVCRDAADLAIATRVVAAKLTAVSDTVATSPLPPEKVRAALERKKLVPRMIGGAAHAVQARSAADDAAQLARHARSQRELADRIGNEGLRRHADHLQREADLANDPSRRFKVDGPFAFTPARAAAAEATKPSRRR